LFYHGDILGLSGTPPRHATSEKGIMVDRFCPIVYEYITDDAVDDKILNDYRIIVHLLPLNNYKTHKVTTKTGGFVTSEREHYAYWTNQIEKTFSLGNKQKMRIMRMQGLMQYKTKENYAKNFLLKNVDDKCIIFCNNTDQADRVCENSYHSKNPNSEDNLEAFKQGIDIHTATAARVYGIEVKDVSSEQRRNAKAVNFGIIYGQSAFGLSQSLGIPRKEAATIIDEYWKQYPNIKNYMNITINFAKENGYVQTLMGRRRYLRDINSANFTVRGFAERNAINAPVQGSAADMIKLAMINIYNRMQQLGNLKSKMILQVHDELLFDVYKPEVELMKQLVKEEMEKAMPILVPVVVESGIGENWLEAH
jgi:hypothetical protein